MLQIVDNTQNHNFVDQYVEFGFDLTGVPVVATANDLDSLIEPIRNRFEVIELDDYSPDEKRVIAAKYLLPGVLREIGLLGKIKFSKKLLGRIIKSNSKESGMRQIERDLRYLICRTALKVVRGEVKFPAVIRERDHQHLEATGRSRQMIGFCVR